MLGAATMSVYVLSCMGITVLVVWPTHGPGAWLRDGLLRRVLSKAGGRALDCYICFSTWVALVASVVWSLEGYRWTLIAWPIVPLGFWVLLPESRSGD